MTVFTNRVRNERGRRPTRLFRISSGYWFVAPAMLFFVVLAIYPAAYVIYLSIFATGKGAAVEPAFSGFTNYSAVWNSPILRQVVTQTISYAGGATVFHLLLGLIVALLLNVLPINRGFIQASRTLFLIPWAISPTVVAVIGRLLMHPQVGPISIGLRRLGMDVVFGPLGDPDLALLAVTATNVWNFTPFYMLMILAGLQSIDAGIYEAALVDGASVWQQIRYVTLPAIRNLLLTLAIFDFVTTAAYFDLTWIMTQGGPISRTEILPTWAYRTAFLSFEFGKASAIGMILFVVSIGISALVISQMERE